MIDTGPQPDLTPDVQSRLRALYRTNQQPSAERRRALVAFAGDMASARRRLRTWRAIGMAATVALVGAVVALWATWPSGSAVHSASLTSADPMDLNRDGVVDMLDALAARRALDAGGDVHVAGVRGPSAIDAIAQRAVRLPARTPGAGGDA